MRLNNTTVAIFIRKYTNTNPYPALIPTSTKVIIDVTMVSKYCTCRLCHLPDTERRKEKSYSQTPGRSRAGLWPGYSTAPQAHWGCPGHIHEAGSEGKPGCGARKHATRAHILCLNPLQQTSQRGPPGNLLTPTSGKHTAFSILHSVGE